MNQYLILMFIGIVVVIFWCIMIMNSIPKRAKMVSAIKEIMENAEKEKIANIVRDEIDKLSLSQKIDELEEKLQSICKHEQGFNYKFDNIHGYVSKVRVCRSCGVLQSYLTFDDFDADRKAQEIKECEEKLKKLKGDKKCTK